MLTEELLQAVHEEFIYDIIIQGIVSTTWYHTAVIIESFPITDLVLTFVVVWKWLKSLCLKSES